MSTSDVDMGLSAGQKVFTGANFGKRMAMKEGIT
jgi:hypothetical protein